MLNVKISVLYHTENNTNNNIFECTVKVERETIFCTEVSTLVVTCCGNTGKFEKYRWLTLTFSDLVSRRNANALVQQCFVIKQHSMRTIRQSILLHPLKIMAYVIFSSFSKNWTSIYIWSSYIWPLFKKGKICKLYIKLWPVFRMQNNTLSCRACGKDMYWQFDTAKSFFKFLSFLIYFQYHHVWCGNKQQCRKQQWLSVIT